MRLWRRRHTQPVRYYLYISDSKLDMLFEQIDERVLKRISAEFKVDLTLASVTLQRAENPEPVRTAKLRVVERFIDEHHQVGTIQEPGAEYFRGRMDMQWGWLARSRSSESRQPVVIFRGHEASQLVVLAGSRRHVLGEHPAEADADAVAWSAMPNIVAAFGEHISEAPEMGEQVRALRACGSAPSEWSSAVFDTPESHLHAAANLLLYAPKQRLEFLAVPLAEGRAKRHWTVPHWDHGVLGTPLYVALAQEPRSTTRTGGAP